MVAGYTILHHNAPAGRGVSARKLAAIKKVPDTFSLAANYNNGDFRYDRQTAGPMIGVAIRF
jgi:hypothetical protein